MDVEWYKNVRIKRKPRDIELASFEPERQVGSYPNRPYLKMQ
jgi:hypothetical protein